MKFPDLQYGGVTEYLTGNHIIIIIKLELCDHKQIDVT